MMKNILLILLLASVVVALDSCSSTSPSTSPSTSGTTRASTFPYMIGRIEVIGNEPFTKVALRVDESHLFLLTAPKDLEKELTAHQAGLVKLYYSGRRESGKDHYLTVDHFETQDISK
jgi:ABC-type Fe3+-hydroxamate transport system substrate-binding protein